MSDSRWIKTRKLVLERDGYRCLRCLGEATDVHHRHPRQMGGADDKVTYGLANLMSLCREDHGWVHQHPRESYVNGYMLKTGMDPEIVPVMVGSARVTLTKSGEALHLGVCGFF